MPSDYNLTKSKVELYDHEVIQEAICAVPVVILGGIIGKGVSELIETPTGMFLSGTFAMGVGCMVAKFYCLPSLKALASQDAVSSETQTCVVPSEQLCSAPAQ
jgi:hypothetical protein